MANTTPQVRENICTDFNKPLNPTFEVDSDRWDSWLIEPDVKSFHFESDRGKFTARKEGRSTTGNEYWYAYRKVAGKLRKVYIGAMDEISGDRLNEVATEISQPAQDYWYSRPRYQARKQLSRLAQASSIVSTLEPIGYPIEDLQDCVTDSSEVEALRLELEQARSQFEKVSDELKILQILKAQTDNALGNLIDRIRSKEKGYKDNGFSQGIHFITDLTERMGL